MQGMIPVKDYTSVGNIEASMKAARAATRARLMGRPPVKRYTPPPEPVQIEKPKSQPKITAVWSAMTPSQKCALVKHHWHDGISTADLAKRVSEAMGEPISRRVVVGLYYRNNERLLKGISFTARGGGVIGCPRPRKTWEADAKAAKKQRDHLLALLRSPANDMGDVILAASKWQGYGVSDIKGYAKYDEVSTARQIVMWLLKTYPARNAVEIGNALDGRCHTTILHGVTRINRLLAEKDRRVLDLIELVKDLPDD